MTDIEEAIAWKPQPTEGAVPRRVDHYSFSPISLPRRPPYAKDPAVRQLATKIMSEIKIDCQEGKLADPWARAAEWLNHPYFSASNRLRMALPGVGIALGIFGVYLGLEWFGIVSAPNLKNHGH